MKNTEDEDDVTDEQQNTISNENNSTDNSIDGSENEEIDQFDKIFEKEKAIDDEEINSDDYVDESNWMRNINDTDASEEDISVTSTSEIIELTQKENWKNKSNSRKKRKSLYLTNVRNGNCLNPTPIKIWEKTIKYKLINTCPFDAVLQATATDYLYRFYNFCKIR